MKRLLIAICILAGAQTVARAQDVSITYQQFYNELEPYGEWINYPPYGYVWEPYFERPDNFTPYSSGGHWVYTEYGWTWVSDYEWGWATFHYGRWFYDDYMGWLWIPGTDWAPAWVTWGSYGGNYGWAPLGPGISISVGMRWRPPHSYWWTFVPCNQFGGSNWNRYIVRNNPTVINNVTIINNVYEERGRPGRPWMRGPRREEVERFSNRSIQPLAINTVRRPEPGRVQNNSLTIYRPRVNIATQGAPVRPGRVQALESARPESRLPAPGDDRRDNNPGNNRPNNGPGNRPGNRPVIPPPAANRPANPPPAANPPGRPLTPRPETRPVNPGTRPENRPGNLPPQKETKPVGPPRRPDPRPDNPVPERPANRPINNPPVQPQPNNPPANQRPVNPRHDNQRPDRPYPPNNNPRPNMPDNPRPNMPPPNRPPGLPPNNRPANPPEHREEPARPPQQHGKPPGKKDDTALLGKKIPNKISVFCVLLLRPQPEA